jgi:hypothetical protein
MYGAELEKAKTKMMITLHLLQYNQIKPNASSIRFNSGPVEPEPTNA